MAIFGWVDKLFGDTNLAQRVILTGSGLPLALVFARNTVPYTAFMRGFLIDSGIPLTGWVQTAASAVLGTALFAAIQYAEIYPLIGAKKRKARGFAHSLSLFAYVVDILACWSFFPPIQGNILIFMFTPSFSRIDWLNLLTGIITVWGGSWWLQLRQKFADENERGGSPSRTVTVQAREV
ncbi:MAG: hypothetical protein EA366_14525 [Spirulina sp. DLM2.Bin59]|nr:MAG: hypothetical protein EA366_14525 [Spirulina sp. DLM2.Bin59]